MRFIYQYRTSDNTLREGVVNAPDREAVYVQLRARGIRASRVTEAPGVLNKLLGRGKRWTAIVILALVSVCAFSFVSVLHRRNDGLLREEEERTTYEIRGQIYGDPAVMRTLMRESDNPYITDRGDLILAAYAIPCRMLDLDVAAIGEAELAALNECIVRNTEISADDLDEVARLKRMINGMKREARQYLADGGSLSGYVQRLEERRIEEFAYYVKIRNEFANATDEDRWREGIVALRERGLPLVERPENALPKKLKIAH